MTLTAALLGFGAASTPVVAVLAVYVILSFAVLDAYYLALERAYRRLYRRVTRGEAEDWTLTADRPTFRDVCGALLRPAVAIFYGTSLSPRPPSPLTSTCVDPASNVRRDSRSSVLRSRACRCRVR